MRASPRTQSSSPRRRDREVTKAKIVDAVGAILARDGFAALGVNALAKQAKVDKVLIYRYFGGLPKVIERFAETASFWPDASDITGDAPEVLRSLPPGDRLAFIFANYARTLRDRPIALAVMAEEPFGNNQLIERAAILREELIGRILALIGGESVPSDIDKPALVTVLLAAAERLVMRQAGTVAAGSQHAILESLEPAIGEICRVCLTGRERPAP